ncbi:hypothetical protein BS47DRAFT_1350552 [Hydnum rufescens UP504]|uniref:Pirin N-terminal domain-containing protein n=1 Tax=Hydnum rufescens UP504 TaxID=1448309 RepID=A0A9P6DS43_9AGAM|nr:hypothetical protein BS47DRAFT_1350552 [Hydnum rufescens UP504]
MLAPSPRYPNVRLVPRLSQERGNADHGWLKTFRTSNFTDYYCSPVNSWSFLTAFNENRVEPSKGIGDSLGNREVLKRGDLQVTSAGTGITQAEYNRSAQKQVHFLQIWAKPNVARLTPKYYTRHYTDEEKKDNTDPFTYLCLRDHNLPSANVLYSFPAVALYRIMRNSYVHVIQTSGYNTGAAKGARVKINGGLELAEGDGAYALGKEGDKLEVEN